MLHDGEYLVFYIFPFNLACIAILSFHTQDFAVLILKHVVLTLYNLVYINLSKALHIFILPLKVFCIFILFFVYSVQLSLFCKAFSLVDV